MGTAPGDFQVSRGRHRVEVRADGYTAVQRTVDVAPQQLSEVSVQLTRPEGTLHIESNVPCEVLVDGRVVGNAPGDFPALPGNHVIDCRLHGYIQGRQEAEVTASETRSVTINLIPVGTGGGSDDGLIIGLSIGGALVVIGGAVALGFLLSGDSQTSPYPGNIGMGTIGVP